MVITVILQHKINQTISVKNSDIWLTIISDRFFLKYKIFNILDFKFKFYCF